MYKPPKREDSASLGKVKMPVETGLPPSPIIKKVLDECLAKKGVQVEQSWMESGSNQKFVLIAQMQEGTTQPVWTLYEESDSGSKMHWSQPFDVNDFGMLYDVICMSAASSGSATKIPDSLKPGASDKVGLASGLSSGLSRSAPASSASPISSTPAPMPAAQAYPTSPAVPAYPSATPAPAPTNNYPAPSAISAYPAPAPAPYPQGYPPYPNSNQTPPQQGYQMQPQMQQPMQPQMQPPMQPTYPQQQPNYGQPQAYPGQAGYSQAPPFGSQPPNLPNQQQPWQQNYSGQQLAPQVPPQAPPTSDPNAFSRPQTFAAQIQTADSQAPLIDYGLLNRKANMLLGELLFEAGLINQRTLDAALKVQDLVREEKISAAEASEILKKHHEQGFSIENYLGKDEFGSDKRQQASNKPPDFTAALKKAQAGTSQANSSTGSSQNKSNNSNSSSSSSSGSSSAGSYSSSSNSSNPSNAAEKPKSEKVKLQLASFDLLEKAGLLKHEDLQTAHTVYKKHGGDIVQILTASGKLDSTTYKAAEVCVPLIANSKMKVEQCIITLNYCSRSRVDFDSALEEMGWDNPRRK